MNNYEFIIASLPVLNQDKNSKKTSGARTGTILNFIREQLSQRDLNALELLMDSYNPQKLNTDFYTKALRSSNRFIRKYVGYDLEVRNTRTWWLNKSLGRKSLQDLIILHEDEEFIPSEEVLAVLDTKDILERESSLDDLMWNKADELTGMEPFTIDRILAYSAQLKIVDRWAKLDPAKGRVLFSKLVEEIRNTRNK